MFPAAAPLDLNKRLKTERRSPQRLLFSKYSELQESGRVFDLMELRSK